jgi:hypothetical protein
MFNNITVYKVLEYFNVWWSNETETRLNIIKGYMLYKELIKNIMILDRIWIESLTQCVWKVVGTIKIVIKTDFLWCF